MEKIRRLALLLKAGIEEQDEAIKTLQHERLKYLRLSMTSSFGDDENSSKSSWLAHLKALEMAQTTRLNAVRQAIINAAVEIQEDLPKNAPRPAMSATSPHRAETALDDSDETELPSDVEKV